MEDLSWCKKTNFENETTGIEKVFIKLKTRAIHLRISSVGHQFINPAKQ